MNIEQKELKRERSREKPKKGSAPLKNESQSDSDFDMFADESDHQKNLQKNEAQLQKMISTDESGYYIPINGSIIGEKYKIIDKLGKGVFGVVLRCLELDSNRQYAIKILRKNDLTEKSGIKQYQILKKIHQKIKSKHIIHVYDHFYEKGHFCFVCQKLSLDLRTYSHKKQLTLQEIRLYAISMFLISHQLRKAQIIHADIKPDNFMFQDIAILNKKVQNVAAQAGVVQTREQEKRLINNLRLVDFGTAYSVQQHNINVEYQVARYYRAPQIILGCQVKKSEIYALDVWSIGCSLFQLLTNQFLFSGNSNNEMLKIIMQTKGRFSLKMLNKSTHFHKYFDDDYNFLYEFVDSQTKNLTQKKMQVTITKQRDLMNLLKKYTVNTDIKQLQNFRDFLQRCLALNPKDRITPQQAMEHPFLHYQTKLTY